MKPHSDEHDWIANPDATATSRRPACSEPSDDSFWTSVFQTLWLGKKVRSSSRMNKSERLAKRYVVLLGKKVSHFQLLGWSNQLGRSNLLAQLVQCHFDLARPARSGAHQKPTKSSLKKPPLARVEARSLGVRAGEGTDVIMNLSQRHLRERFFGKRTERGERRVERGSECTFYVTIKT
ncbi:hypothetical protein F2Q68_00013835 [Brassica cretica]|uniref:Uncharacterized protein n=1 Tax=Brassica cretica TaxID=69181 RepID=A0A8S9HEN4_BRACR|nr:hypothetical protein F2Q68_00013835 [Brassica cretica]